MDFSQLLRHLLFSQLLNGLPPWKVQPLKYIDLERTKKPMKKSKKTVFKNQQKTPKLIRTPFKKKNKEKKWCFLVRTHLKKNKEKTMGVFFLVLNWTFPRFFFPNPRTFNSSVTPTQRLDWPNQFNGIACGSLGIPRLFWLFSQQVVP